MASVACTIWVRPTPGNLIGLRAFEEAEELEPLQPEPGAGWLVVQHTGWARGYDPFELGPVSLGGEAVGLLQDEYDQLVYDRWVDGRRVRGLTCFPEGSGWERVEGTPEAWEAVALGRPGPVQGRPADPRPREAAVRQAVLDGLGLPAPESELDRCWW